MRLGPDTVLLLVIAVIATTAGCQPTTAHELEGLRLGTTLADFRNSAPRENPRDRVVCAGDSTLANQRPARELMSEDSDAAAGIVGCGIYRFGNVLGGASRTLPPEWTPVLQHFGAIPVATTFWFVPPPPGPTGAASPPDATGAPRLFRIQLRCNVAAWDAMWREATRRYGSPAFSKRDSFNGSGRGGADNLVATWDDTTTTLTLTKRDGLATRSTLRLVLKELAWAARDRTDLAR